MPHHHNVFQRYCLSGRHQFPSTATETRDKAADAPADAYDNAHESAPQQKGHGQPTSPNKHAASQEPTLQDKVTQAEEAMAEKDVFDGAARSPSKGLFGMAPTTVAVEDGQRWELGACSPQPREPSPENFNA